MHGSCAIHFYILIFSLPVRPVTDEYIILSIHMKNVKYAVPTTRGHSPHTIQGCIKFVEHLVES